LPTFADRGCHVVTVTDPYCRTIEIQPTETYVQCMLKGDKKAYAKDSFELQGIRNFGRPVMT
jgi:hypothetical protein